MVICYSAQETNTTALVIWSLCFLWRTLDTLQAQESYIPVLSDWNILLQDIQMASPVLSWSTTSLVTVSNAAVPSTPVLHSNFSPQHLIHFVSLANVFMICLHPQPWKHKLIGGRGLGLLSLSWISSACILPMAWKALKIYLRNAHTHERMKEPGLDPEPWPQCDHFRFWIRSLC